MTVADLIDALSVWPLGAEVGVVGEYGGFVFPIMRVSGAAGSAIDGHDGYVTITVLTDDPAA